jgi:hypothetical protein
MNSTRTQMNASGPAKNSKRSYRRPMKVADIPPLQKLRPHVETPQQPDGLRGAYKLVAGGWWLVAGGWWLVAGGWWLVAGGWWLVAGRNRITDTRIVNSRDGLPAG